MTSSVLAQRQMFRWAMARRQLMVVPPAITTSSSWPFVAPNNMLLQLTPQQQHRSKGSKAGKMGNHLEKIKEMSHRESHREAKERREAKKLHNKEGRKAAHHHHDEEQVELVEVLFEANDDKFDEYDEESESPVLPDAAVVKERMMKVVTAMADSFKSIRGAEPTPELFDPIIVEAYGEKTTLSSVAQVVIVGPTLATVTCFDPSLAKDVRNAIMIALEVNPQLEEDGVIRVPLPRASAESRQKTVQQLGKQAEVGRRRIRNIRRGAMDVVKKGKDGKLEHISKDDAFRVGKEIDAVTEDVIKTLNVKVEKKQESVMAV